LRSKQTRLFCMQLPVDKSYWRTELVPPYSPSDEDVAFYRSKLGLGTTLLLGCTHKLLPLSTAQMDHDPWYEGSTVIISDWRENDISYDNMIGDGVLNFTKELTDSVLVMCSRKTKVFVARCFNRKLAKMRIADHFPSADEFCIRPSETVAQLDYSFHVWRF